MEWWRSPSDESYVEVWTAAGAFARTAEQAEAIAELLGLAQGGGGPSHTQLRRAERRNPGPRHLEADMRHPPGGPR